MNNVFRHGKGTSIKERFRNRELLLRPFIKKYKRPVLVHAVNSLKAFNKILEGDTLKLPSEHKQCIKCSSMANFLGTDKSIFFSIGFVYATAYNFKYNLIFDLRFLKDLNFYKRLLTFNCYKSVVDYWYNNDSAYLDKLSNKNVLTKEVVQKYYLAVQSDPETAAIEFWRIERILFKHIEQYYNKPILFKLIKNARKKCLAKYPASVRLAIKDAPFGKNSEVLSNKSIQLSKNPWFQGFYIAGKPSVKLLNLLKNKYPSKVFFDGKKIMLLSDLKLKK